MSEREGSGGGGGGGGFGAFLLGLAVGAVAGLLFAPDAGEGTRRKLSRRMRGLREFAGEKADEVRALLEEAGAEEDEDETANDEPESVRAELERRLAAARRRRKGRLAPGAEVEEEDEPVA